MIIPFLFPNKIFINQFMRLAQLQLAINVQKMYIQYPPQINSFTKFFSFYNHHKELTLKITIESQTYLIKNLVALGYDWESKNDKFYVDANSYYIWIRNPSISTPLAFMTYSFFQKLQLQDKKLISRQQLLSIFQKTTEQYSQDNIQQKADLFLILLKLRHQLKQIQNQIVDLQNKANRMFRAYLNALTILTLCQFIGAAYGIFFVQWLGWDIIEPYTYTIGQSSVLLSIYFFLKHYTDRSYDSIEGIFKKRALKRQKFRYNQLLLLYRQKMQRIKRIDQQIELLEAHAEGLYYQLHKQR